MSHSHSPDHRILSSVVSVLPSLFPGIKLCLSPLPLPAHPSPLTRTCLAGPSLLPRASRVSPPRSIIVYSPMSNDNARLSPVRRRPCPALCICCPAVLPNYALFLRAQCCPTCSAPFPSCHPPYQTSYLVRARAFLPLVPLLVYLVRCVCVSCLLLSLPPVSHTLCRTGQPPSIPSLSVPIASSSFTGSSTRHRLLYLQLYIRRPPHRLP
jgi:hypothetical protein